MNTPIISVSQLCKSFTIARRKGRGVQAWFARDYKTVTAVDHISFAIQPGELVGYLGPNGAGKSTTLKMLTGILVPSSGEIVVRGRVPWRERQTHVAGIGAVFGQRDILWWDLPVNDSFDLLKHIYKVPTARFNENLTRFRDILGLDEFLYTPVRALSLGQRMRANLAAALLHDPAIIFLDEPTIGLDVVAKERIRQFIQQINRERGTTVILTTHDLSDVERLCERVMMIDHGKLLFDGPLAELRRRFGGERELLVDFAEDYPDDDLQVDGATLIQREGLRATYRFPQTLSASNLIGRLSSRYRLNDLSVREPQIEDTVRRIYEQQLLVE